MWGAGRNVKSFNLNKSIEGGYTHRPIHNSSFKIKCCTAQSYDQTCLTNTWSNEFGVLFYIWSDAEIKGMLFLLILDNGVCVAVSFILTTVVLAAGLPTPINDVEIVLHRYLEQRESMCHTYIIALLWQYCRGWHTVSCVVNNRYSSWLIA